jgi:prepilin-type N-terminal cleavage/methylation domain-containing protein
MSTALRCLRQVRDRGFTLVELLIVVAVLAVILTLAAPSFREMIEMQRLRGTSAQLTTDIQFARSEAVSRQEVVAISFEPSASGMSCYILHTWPGDLNQPRCSCSAPEGSRCPAVTPPAPQPREIRTVQVPSTTKVRVLPIQAPSAPAAVNVIRFSPITGGMQAYYIGVGGPGLSPVGEAWAEVVLQRPSNPPSLRTMVSLAGRPSVCAPGGRVHGVPAC